MSTNLDIYEDKDRKEKVAEERQNRYSKYCDLVYYKSTISPELTLAMLVYKPEKPSYIKAITHGWHMSMNEFADMEQPLNEYLTVQVDMRGRAYSDGTPDCNGWELHDVIDAVEYVKNHYAEYIIDDSVVYFEGGSGGGGNAYAIACKFPDYFAHVTALCGISDYEQWYKNDSVGEFRDELDVWIGSIDNKEAYASRSGLTGVPNLCTYMSIAHGTADLRVSIEQARQFVDMAKKNGKGKYISYMELPDVGGQKHWQNATDDQLQKMHVFCEDGRKAHRTPVKIPRKGRMIVCGYLFTMEFSVVLNSIDRVAEVEYDLDKRNIEVKGLKNDEYIMNMSF